MEGINYNKIIKLLIEFNEYGKAIEFQTKGFVSNMIIKNIQINGKVSYYNCVIENCELNSMNRWNDNVGNTISNCKIYNSKIDNFSIKDSKISDTEVTHGRNIENSKIIKRYKTKNHYDKCDCSYITNSEIFRIKLLANNIDNLVQKKSLIKCTNVKNSIVDNNYNITNNIDNCIIKKDYIGNRGYYNTITINNSVFTDKCHINNAVINDSTFKVIPEYIEESKINNCKLPKNAICSFDYKSITMSNIPITKELAKKFNIIWHEFDKGIYRFIKPNDDKLEFNINTGELIKTVGERKTKLKSTKSFFESIKRHEMCNMVFPFDKIYKRCDPRHRVKNIGTMMDRFIKKVHLEGYYKIDGIKFDSNITKPVEIYDKDIIQLFIDLEVYIDYTVEQKYLEDKDKFRSIYKRKQNIINNPYFDKICDEMNNEFRTSKRSLKEGIVSNSNYYERIVGLINEYNCDIEKLYHFIKKEKNSKNSPRECFRYLYDYYTNMKLMNRKPKKYPDNIDWLHDKTSEEYRAMKTKYDDKAIEKNQLDKYGWEPKRGEFKGMKIVVPKTSQAIKDEATEMRNCLAQRIPGVVRGVANIFMLRYTDNPDISQVCFEVRDGRMYEKQGRYMERTIKPQEVKFLKAWCERNNIVYA